MPPSSTSPKTISTTCVHDSGGSYEPDLLVCIQQPDVRLAPAGERRRQLGAGDDRSKQQLHRSQRRLACAITAEPDVLVEQSTEYGFVPETLAVLRSLNMLNLLDNTLPVRSQGRCARFLPQLAGLVQQRQPVGGSATAPHQGGPARESMAENLMIRMPFLG